MNETPAQELDRLAIEIPYHRQKAVSLRRRADTQDAIADKKVKRAAELGTPDLTRLHIPDAPT